jgi:hypothetical protein
LAVKRMPTSVGGGSKPFQDESPKRLRARRSARPQGSARRRRTAANLRPLILRESSGKPPAPARRAALWPDRGVCEAGAPQPRCPVLPPFWALFCLFLKQMLR